MSEPASTASGSTSLAAALVALLGPIAGDYAAIVFAALAGAMWPLSERDGLTRSDGAWLLLRLVGTSVALTGLVAWAVHRYAEVPVSLALAPVSWAIAAFGDRWRGLIGQLAARVRRTIAAGDKP